MNLKTQIAESHKLADALQIIAAKPKAYGAIKLNYRSMTAAVAFSRGRLTGALIKQTGERAEAALKQLLSWDGAQLSYAKFSSKNLAEPERMDIDIATLLIELQNLSCETVEISNLAAVSTQPTTIETAPGSSFADALVDPEETTDLSKVPFEARWTDDKETDRYEEQRFELLIARLDAQADQAEFASVVGIQDNALHYGHPILLPIELSTNDCRPESFFQCDPLLSDDKPERFVLDLENLDEQFIDAEPFDRSSSLLNGEDDCALTLEQRKLLAAIADSQEGIVKAAFEESGALLFQEESQLRAEKLWELQEVRQAQTREEQSRDFALKDERMQQPVPGSCHIPALPIGDLVFQDDANTNESDPLCVVQPIPADYSPARFWSEAEPRRRSKICGGIIGRVSDLVAGNLPVWRNAARRRQQFGTGKTLALAMLSLFCLGLVTIPAKIEGTTADAAQESLIDRQMEHSVFDQVSDDTPTIARAHMPAPVSQPAPPSSCSSSSEETAGNSLENDAHAYGKRLLIEGKIANAIAYLEQYVESNPSNVAARIELIQAYLLMKLRAKARLMCISTFKCAHTKMQDALIWELLQQCLTD